MTGVGRNEPCICGSGKKFKHCCGNNVVPFRRPLSQADKRPQKTGPLSASSEVASVATASARVGSSGSASASSEVASVGAAFVSTGGAAVGAAGLGLGLEHLEGLTTEDLKRLNQVGQGLSIDQMATILEEPPSLNNSIFSFFPHAMAHHSQDEVDVTSSNFLVPRMGHVILGCLKELAGQVEETAEGGFSAYFIHCIIDTFVGPVASFKQGKSKEAYLVSIIQVVGSLLQWGGFIKKRNQRFFLTQKGMAVYRKDDVVFLWATFMQDMCSKWCWQSGRPQFYRGAMQETFVFLIYLLHKKAQKYVRVYDVFEDYVKAFPHILENPVNALPPDFDGSNFSYRDEAFSFFFMHVVNHILKPMGLVQLHRVPLSVESLNIDDTLKVWKQVEFRVTPCFRDAFVFKPSLRGTSASQPTSLQDPSH